MKRPRRLRRRHSPEAVRAVVDETVALYHRLRWIGEQIYGAEGRSTARRGILRGLVRYGAQTVPKLARMRGVSRQHVQLVIDSLRRDRLVEARPNPVHRRSPLVRATALGERMVHRMDAFDAAVLGSVSYAASARDLKLAALTLQRLRGALEIGNWQAALPRTIPW